MEKYTKTAKSRAPHVKPTCGPPAGRPEELWTIEQTRKKIVAEGGEVSCIKYNLLFPSPIACTSALTLILLQNLFSGEVEQRKANGRDENLYLEALVFPDIVNKDGNWGLRIVKRSCLETLEVDIIRVGCLCRGVLNTLREEERLQGKYVGAEVIIRRSERPCALKV